ncbi:uncharacterized protein F5Z01DRAFT_99330 [Emericellopsis atlantica]|uniref:BZIP domain-containing protein n=1 Tax=Emericellopsis atlantica TaxID=2614577 RepID=A0A9P8CQ91_9HYPO|nr:uncharacterized protein F5Z01DRAFT_99330 [Emericellopsis atlantica]KAG9254865.1 hypothetical protein F5Z01DRAFT_99330 [Emericellopsis atlantica]
MMQADDAEDAATQCRRVSNMTPAQVARKRAIDRDNQRHLRAKRKAHTRHLEEQITSLQQKLAEAEARIAVLERDTPRQPLPGLDMTSLASMTMPLELGPGITLDMTQQGGLFDLLDMNLDTDLHVHTDLDVNLPPATDWAVPIRHTPPTNRLDRFITGTVEAWRGRLSSRQSAELSAASQFPNVSALLEHPPGARLRAPPVSDSDSDSMSGISGQPLSSAASAHIHGSPLQPLVERLGMLYCLSHLVRWLVCLSRETYDRMPAFMRPTSLQRAVPHPAWVDLVLFPAARDDIIRLRDWSPDRFEAYRAATARSLSANWPYADSGAVVESESGDHDGQRAALNPIFEAHVRNLDNWTVSPEVAAAFPYMAPYVRVRRERSIGKRA